MCAIYVLTGKSITPAEAELAFYRTASRGPDMSNFSETAEGYVGFHRLAIMGLNAAGMQPFYRGGNFVVCNGELYGFRKVKRELEEMGYSFISDSDCEILLPLYELYGTDMFARLDAEFACVIYDAKTRSYIAARDPIGIRPLYYGYMADGKIAFASEPKNLVSVVEGQILPFPPGHYYKDGKFVCYLDLTRVHTVIHDDPETVCKNIREKLIAGVEKRLDADAPVGFLLSGGLDSSLVCAIAQKLLPRPIRTFAVGMRKDAIDLKYAREVADYIGSEHTEIYMTREDVLESLEFVIKSLGTYDITTIRASMGMYLLCRQIHLSTNVRVLLTGEISDELFG
ncbi:MAG TPA: asparagine synthase (glutamine-hydrolyzing), partial [Candidatus Gallimonas intestinigallinarum]|nr:asparagine synthase (glutamine-hydrolyzing) [Candidatus Gallimonas intestinigallinarum]